MESGSGDGSCEVRETMETMERYSLRDRLELMYQVLSD